MRINNYNKILNFCNLQCMELTTNQIIATVVSSIVILKISIMFLLPKSSFKKFISIYDNINVDILYYIYTIIGSLLIYYIYVSSNFNLSDIFVIGFPLSLIVSAAMLKMLGGERLSKIMARFKTATQMFQSLWLYLLFWIIFSIMVLKEIFFS